MMLSLLTAQKGASRAPTNLLIPIFRAGALLLSIPSIVLSSPSPQLPRVFYRCCPVNPAGLLTTLSVVLLSLVPPSSLATIIRDLTLFLACSGTFLLPGDYFPAFRSLIESDQITWSSGGAHHGPLSPTSSHHRRTSNITRVVGRPASQRRGIGLATAPRPPTPAKGATSAATTVVQTSAMGRWDMAATRPVLCGGVDLGCRSLGAQVVASQE